MPNQDIDVRLAAFRFLEEQTRLAGESGALSRVVLQRGFDFQGQRVPLMSPQGIFKPKACPEMPLSLTTVAVAEGDERPYDDLVGGDGLLRYRYRGNDPAHVHPDNIRLRLAMQRRAPLIYFHGIVPGLYVAEWPVFVVGDDPRQMTFTVSIDERRFAGLGASPPESDDAEIRRRYATRIFQQRLHQSEFRDRVVRAYQHHCAICRLRRNELLQAAHILPDKDPLGLPRVPNGLALCNLHHAAFDAHIIGIRPDYVIEIREDVLSEKDGPMLIHGLQGFHEHELFIPEQETSRPDRALLEERYRLFRRRAG